MYIPLPFQPTIFPNEQTHRLNVWAVAHLLGLDVVRLEAYRQAIRAGLYSDQLKDGE